MANLSIDLSELELQEFGTWPLLVKMIIVALIFLLTCMFGFWVDSKKMRAVLENAQKTEVLLKSTYEQKQYRSVNILAYREQIKSIKTSFGDLLTQLPEKTEVPALVEDLSLQGLAAGLEFQGIKLLPEQKVNFYIELPIELSMVGSYHQLANFVSNVAALSRIVTLHDFMITPLPTSAKEGSQLLMTMTAKTYRYIAEDTEGIRS